MVAGTGVLLTRDEFAQQRKAAALAERNAGRMLASFSIAGGALQLLLLRWGDLHMARGPRLATAVAAFAAYIVIVAVLLIRRDRRLRAVRPRCPQCGKTIEGVSERIAIATGNCDRCGGRIVATSE